MAGYKVKEIRLDGTEFGKEGKLLELVIAVGGRQLNAHANELVTAHRRVAIQPLFRLKKVSNS